LCTGSFVADIFCLYQPASGRSPVTKILLTL
jgi:hypothetical protein